MANFEIAERKTAVIEGGYVNDPDDPGGETICGISRKFHPDLELWKLVDGFSNKHMAPLNAVISQHIHEFYKEKFWDCYLGDSISEQDIANEIYDSGVLVGQKRITEWVQIALNVLNRNQNSYPDLKVDGDFGYITLGMLNDATYFHKEKENILKLLNAYLGAYLSFKCEESPSKEKYIHGWLNARVTV